MTNEPTRDPQHPANPVPYELALAQNSNHPSRLTSPLLDQAIHHGHAVDVTFERDAAATTPEQLDPFQLDSLVQYLTNQQNIRRALEAALDRNHDASDYSHDFPRGSAVWSVVRINVVAFERRKIITREDALSAREIFPNLTDEFIEQSLADADTPDTRSKFTVMFAGPWDDAHLRMAYFRDGALRYLAIDG
jgi:hypothetical protein